MNKYRNTLRWISIVPFSFLGTIILVTGFIWILDPILRKIYSSLFGPIGGKTWLSISIPFWVFVATSIFVLLGSIVAPSKKRLVALMHTGFCIFVTVRMFGVHRLSHIREPIQLFSVFDFIRSPLFGAILGGILGYLLSNMRTRSSSSTFRLH